MENKIVPALIKRLKAVPAELLVLGLSGILIITSLAVFILIERSGSEPAVYTSQEYAASSEASLTEKTADNSKIAVYIAGAVQNPGVYEFTTQSRLGDLIKAAGDFSLAADQVYFARSFNPAQFIQDQDKFYIPSKQEVSQGIVMGIQTKQTLAVQTNQGGGLISINTASQSVLEELPGIGPVSAQKIISQRPYSGIEELRDKKVIGNSLFDKIKDLIQL